MTLGKAVPPSQEVPALIDQLTQASNEKNVDFASITAGGGGGASTPASASAASAASGAAAAGFTQLPFTFTFEGSYFDLERLFRQLTGFAVLNTAGDLQVSGRLLTVQSVKLSPPTGSSEPSKGGAGKLTGSITATAYVLPASQGLISSATPSAPAGATAPASTSTAAPSSATAPAIVRVNP